MFTLENEIKRSPVLMDFTGAHISYRIRVLRGTIMYKTHSHMPN